MPSASPHSNITLEPITPETAMAYKAVRLRALRDTPSAFGSTYAREREISDAGWADRARQWNGPRSIARLSKCDGQYCGIIAGFFDEQNSAVGHLASMWVASDHRRLGIGRMLVDAVRAWARPRGIRQLRLMVTSSNDAAIAFYRRLGFKMTGQTAPYPNDPALIELEMAAELN